MKSTVLTLEVNELVERVRADGSTLMLLLRHADRGPLPEGEPGNEVSLLPHGVDRAVAFGAALGKDLSSMHTSPVPRCVQTAEAIIQGAEQALPVGHDKHLGDPGVYVIEGGIAWEAWQEMGHEQVVDSIVRGVHLPGLADPIPATRRLVAWMRQSAGNRPGIHVFVTHDLLVTAAAAHCLGTHLTAQDWPDFLECLTLHEEGGRLFASYRELSGVVAVP